MLSGIYFLGSIIVVFIVFNWFIDNDKVPANEPTTGLLAFKQPDPNEKPKRRGPKQWTRDGR